MHNRHGRLLRAGCLALLIGCTAATTTAGPKLTAAQVRSDLDVLYTSLQAAHYNLYARVAKADYDRQYAALRAALGSASRFDVAVELQRFVAFGAVAHARVDEMYRAFASYQAAGGAAFPLRIRVVDDQVFVIENRSGLAEVQRGDAVVALNGRPIAEWIARGRGQLSADTPYMAHALMELDFPMLLWLELGPVAGFDVTLARAGQAIALRIPARTDPQQQAAAAPQPPVLALSRGRSARMLDGKLAYLRPGPFYNDAPGATNEYDATAFRTFIDGAFAGFATAGADRLLIDLRNNPGGDSSFSDLMVGWFADRPFSFTSAFKIKVSAQAIASNAKRVQLAPADVDDISHQYATAYAHARPGEVIAFAVPAGQPHAEPRFHGKVYVLVNRHSYSNTVAVAALIQDAHLGTVLGEETSDLATTYGAMETFTLPNSGLEVGFPKAFIVRPNGDLTARGVVPDVRIETPVVEGVEDPVLLRAIALCFTPTR